MRAVSGNKCLTVPCWEYYKNPRIPAQFLDSASSSPLYVSHVGTSVCNALPPAPRR